MNILSPLSPPVLLNLLNLLCILGPTDKDLKKDLLAEKNLNGLAARNAIASLMCRFC